MKHGHVQIQYQNEKDLCVESLIGFNPNSEEDRKLVHEMLDEYLDRYLVPRFNGDNRKVNEDDGFRVFNLIDDH